MAAEVDKLRRAAVIRCSDFDRVAPSYESRERRRLQAEALAEAARLGAPTQTPDGATNPRLEIVGDQ